MAQIPEFVAQLIDVGIDLRLGIVMVCDLGHFLHLGPDTPNPTRLLADRLSDLVRAATARPEGFRWTTTVQCHRRPGHEPCREPIAVHRSAGRGEITWECTGCDDAGLITGWEHSVYDISTIFDDEPSDGAVSVEISFGDVAALRGVMTLSRPRDRLVWGAYSFGGHARMMGELDVFEELVDAVAAEANHEHNDARRQT